MEALDRLFSTVMRLQAGGLCERCRNRGTDTAHVIPRRYKAVRWEAMNAFWLCRKCHDLLGDAKLGKPSRMQRFYEARYGPRVFERLCRDALGVVQDLENVRVSLVRQLEVLRA